MFQRSRFFLFFIFVLLASLSFEAAAKSKYKNRSKRVRVCKSLTNTKNVRQCKPRRHRKPVVKDVVATQIPFVELPVVEIKSEIIQEIEFSHTTINRLSYEKPLPELLPIFCGAVPKNELTPLPPLLARKSESLEFSRSSEDEFIESAKKRVLTARDSRIRTSKKASATVLCSCPIPGSDEVLATVVTNYHVAKSETQLQKYIEIENVPSEVLEPKVKDFKRVAVKTRGDTFYLPDMVVVRAKMKLPVFEPMEFGNPTGDIVSIAYPGGKFTVSKGKHRFNGPMGEYEDSAGGEGSSGGFIVIPDEQKFGGLRFGLDKTQKLNVNIPGKTVKGLLDRYWPGWNECPGSILVDNLKNGKQGQVASAVNKVPSVAISSLGDNTAPQ